jgi:hypothetical protein
VGPGCQRRGVKKKKREGERWAGAGGGLGRLGRKGAGAGFVFFSFLFPNFFFKPFFFSNSNQILSNFSQKFINFLETTQATKNHASQLMMHIHLLSLSLLNYIYYF